MSLLSPIATVPELPDTIEFVVMAFMVAFDEFRFVVLLSVHDIVFIVPVLVTVRSVNVAVLIRLIFN